MFLRRIGPDPHRNGRKTEAASGCPDIWELESGDFAVIGITMDREAATQLPPTAGVGADETMVRLPRRVLVEAKPAIPSA